METTIRKLPVGIQDFEKLRTGDYAYVDKTQYIYELGCTERPYFLGRPRRFGKSLFLSTLKAYFEGKRALFDGLAIAALEKDWTAYPVIYLDFNQSGYSDLQTAKYVLDNILSKYEQKYNITNIAKVLSSRLNNLIEGACQQTGKKVVVLVDEYDKPLINSMDKPQLNEEFRNFLKGFYGVLKSADACLRFVFLTGVTKFSKVSIFSDLNQLTDISLDERFAGICGISEAELLRCFQPELQALAEKRKMTADEAFAEMKKRYDGYHFAKESEDMYNPFSVLNTFASRDFADYWFKTGTPTFLAKMIVNSNFDIRSFIDNITIATRSIDDYRVGESSLVPLMYQSGYLTIKSYDPEYDEFLLGFPNEEVKYGFLNELLPVYAPEAGLDTSFSASRFVKALVRGDTEGFMTQLTAFFASIPYDAVRQARCDEQHYQYTFWLLFTLMGQFVQTEVKSAKGRADAVVKTADAIYVFEFKMDDSATAEDALRQIDDKGYLIPYTSDGRRTVKVGVEFSVAERGVKRWMEK